MIRRSIPRWQVVVLGVLSIVVLLAGYTYLSHRQHLRNPDDTTIPSWGQLREGVATAVQPNPRSGERWLLVDLRATMTRLFTGLFFGIAGAVVCGLLMGCSRRVEAFLAPPLSILAKIPPTAALGVFFVLFGTELKMYAAMIAFGILPMLAQTIYLSVDEIPEEMLDKASTLGASNLELVWNVIVRVILPRMIDAVRLVIGPAMVYLIAAEMVVSDVGFGYRIRMQSRLLNMNVVYPYLAVLAGFGFLMDSLMRRLRKLCAPWYGARGS